MRSTGWLLLGALVLAACGDNQFIPPPDAGPACSDGIDNDGDGLTDYPADPGCADADGDTEDGLVAPQCDDGSDNDGDGKIDYPNDPGCFAAVADSEVDDCPTGPGCPQCANGIDDDGSGATDYPDDPGCESAADVFEFAENPNACGAGLLIKQLPPTGMDEDMLVTTSTFQLAPSCGGITGGPAIAYQIALTEPRVMVASTVGSAVDTVLSLRGASCTDPGSELACHDDLSTSNESSTITESLAAGNYYLIVSGATATELGMYTLKVEFFTGEGEVCGVDEECGPGLVCRVPVGETEMVCAPPVCSDGADDDGDGKTDYPDDPGCTSETDDSEDDDCPGGASCPACGNEIDDDMDGATDYPADTSCVSASGTSEACEQSEPVGQITSGTTTGTTAGATDDFRPPPGSINGHLCSTSGTHTAPDVAYTIDLPAMRSLNMELTLSPTWDSTLLLLDATCGGTPVECSDNRIMPTQTDLPEGRYYVVVDGYSTASGNFTLDIEGVIASGGRCDPEYTLNGALQCPVDNPCEGPPGNMRCRPSACGDGMDNDMDGFTDYPDEPGCTSLEDLDESDTCAQGPGPGCPECGDGIDNDGDGQIDLADTNCPVRSMPSEGCPTTDGLAEITQPITPGTTAGGNDDVTPTCTTSTHSAPDAHYMLQLPALRNLKIVNDNAFDAVVSLMDSTCAGTPVSCKDTPEDITLNNVPAGTYFYVVDGKTTGNGAFDIIVSGTIQNGGSCEVPLAQSGALTCGLGFTCKGPAGSRTCLPASCSDGIDNDGDGIADFPSDPGCASQSDDDETDDCPSGPNCPTCADGQDNDGDLLVDYPFDPSCYAASASSEACPAFDGITPITTPTIDGTTEGAIDDWIATCGTSTVTPSAGDLLYSLEVPDLLSLTIENDNAFDAIVSLFDQTCEGAQPELVCSDEPETITRTNLPAGTYYYMVDGDGTAEGEYTITVSGVIAPGASCEVPLALAGALTCDVGYACRGTLGSRTCEVSICNDTIDNDGDGKIDYPWEPGCDSPSDDDETDPPTMPVCANGVDDDADGYVDFPEDPNCTAASHTSETCIQTEPIGTITQMMTMGTTAGTTNDVVPTCGSTTTQTAPDLVYELRVPAMATLDIDITFPSGSWDSAHSVIGPDCVDTLSCSDPPGANPLTNLAAGTYYVVVDGWGSASGAFTINTTGTVAPGGSCEGELFQAGAFTCAAGTTCTGPAGARTCQAQCSDGIDNNGDGLIDYPLDPACESGADDTEDVVCPGPSCPVCSNGMDDDGDATMDYPGDLGCVAAGGTSEVFCPTEVDPTGVITTPLTTGTTTGAANNFASSPTCGATTGEDVVLALSLPVPVRKMTFDLSGSAAGFDTMLSLRDAQCGTELGCDDDSGVDDTSRMAVWNLPPGNYAVIVDGRLSEDGEYALEVEGVVTAGTACDSPLFGTGVLVCPPGTTCSGTPAICQ